MLTGLQSDFRQSDRRKLNAFGLVTVVCLVLLALLAVVQVTHLHPINEDADNCPLCIALQTAAPVAIAATMLLMVRIWAQTPVFAERAVVRHRHPKLFTRPPPSVR